VRDGGGAGAGFSCLLFSGVDGSAGGRDFFAGLEVRAGPAFFAGARFFFAAARAAPGAATTIASATAAATHAAWANARIPLPVLRPLMRVIVHRAPMSMHRRPLRGALARALVAVLLSAAPACKRKPPAPRFCPQDLSGVWVNASDATFGYRLRDRGERVEGLFFHRAPDGGVVQPDPTEEPITLDLHRSDAALAGAMHTFDRTPGGRRCPVEFGLSVTACNPDYLQVATEIATAIDESCKRPREADGGEAQPDLAEFVWEKPDGGASPGRP
jgi:hypothetical protein